MLWVVKCCGGGGKIQSARVGLTGAGMRQLEIKQRAGCQRRPCPSQPDARRRQAVVAANSELQEREALKRDGLTSAMAQALSERGVPEPAASLGAELGMLAFRTAFARWIEPGSDAEFAQLARDALDELMTASAVLSASTLAS